MAIAQTQQQVTAVLGIGVTGLSVARFLTQRGLPFVMADTRDKPPALAVFKAQFPAVACYLGDEASKVLDIAAELIVSPGIAPTESILVDAGEKALAIAGDIELFARFAEAPVIAITGSNGKSTVTELVGEMAQTAGRRVAVGGNLGTPALDLINDDVELYILELSSFQLEWLSSLQPAVATILNVSEDHLDRYQTLEQYLAAKQRIFSAAKCVVVNRDDPASAVITPVSEEFGFTLNAPVNSDFGVVEQRDGSWLVGPAGPLMPVSEVPIKGRHNWANALAALALGSAVGLPLADMLTALRRFGGLRHRCQTVRELNGVIYINDSKATNVGAALAALQGLAATGQANLIWIAGGEGKGADFSELADTVGRHVKCALLIGTDAGQIAASIPGNVPVEKCDSLQAAVAIAAEKALPGDIVLLSPACASFDMFRNFEARGDVFIEAVNRLVATGDDAQRGVNK